MRKLLLVLLFLGAPALGFAAGPEIQLMKARVDSSDTASLQRGAKLFVNYCAGCHSAEYMRLTRLAQDLDLPADLVEQYLIFTGAKIGDTMHTAMDPNDGKRWFGVTPPDLTLTARRRGADWVYTYLNTFYRDDSRPLGVNNLVFPDVGMPHVLWSLQGLPEPVYADAGQDGLKIVGVRVPEGSGQMSEREYLEASRDLTNFLVYMSEPIKSYRQSLGVKVILFLLVFLVLALLLKREYWKDIH
ncbi:MAG TPA: cytochrome c1 [Gammaproteobacteria bacterium]|nr:cytochrome c1 [Gammaproteobacteria bacterium]